MSGDKAPNFGRAVADRDPMVSIIIPAYNTAKYIGAALDSVLSQTFTDYEIIIINDGSDDTDQLESLLARYDARLVYLKQENRGSSAARNAGLRVARGKYIALLDSDDLWEPEYLAVHVDALERNPSTDIIFPNARLFGDTTLSGRSYMDLLPVEGEITWPRLIAGQCHVWYGVTARREVFLEAGGFDETLATAEDLDLWLRVLWQGRRFAYHRRVLAHYRKRSDSHTANALKLYSNFLQLLDKIKETRPLTEEEQAIVDRCYALTLVEMKRCTGKQALLAGDIGGAIAHLSEVNTLSPRTKLRAVLFFLRSVPEMVRKAYRWRIRLTGE